MGKKEAYHDEIELEDFEYDEEEDTYYYPCPCGDRFAITTQELSWGIEVATCPSCSLIVKVIYDFDVRFPFLLFCKNIYLLTVKIYFLLTYRVFHLKVD